MNRNSKVRRDNPFKTQRVFRPKFTITHRITTDLTRIERARGFLEAATLSEDWIRAMGERALVLEAHHTTHIEGTRLTLEQAERLWVGEKVPEADPDDVRELLNYRKAFDLVAEYLNSGSPITEGMIRDYEKLYPTVNRRTLQRDLQHMVQVSVLYTEGSTHQLVYRLREHG